MRGQGVEDKCDWRGRIPNERDPDKGYTSHGENCSSQLLHRKVVFWRAGDVSPLMLHYIRGLTSPARLKNAILGLPQFQLREVYNTHGT